MPCPLTWHTPRLICTLSVTWVSVKVNTAAMFTPAVASASTITVNIVNRDLHIFILG